MSEKPDLCCAGIKTSFGIMLKGDTIDHLMDEFAIAGSHQDPLNLQDVTRWMEDLDNVGVGLPHRMAAQIAREVVQKLLIEGYIERATADGRKAQTWWATGTNARIKRHRKRVRQEDAYRERLKKDPNAPEPEWEDDQDW